MAKQGMARPDWTKRPRNSAPPVPEIQGKAKTTKTPARPIIAGTSGPQQKVYHSTPHGDRPISAAHGIIDTDLARITWKTTSLPQTSRTCDPSAVAGETALHARNGSEGSGPCGTCSAATLRPAPKQPKDAPKTVHPP